MTNKLDETRFVELENIDSFDVMNLLFYIFTYKITFAYANQASEYRRESRSRVKKTAIGCHQLTPAKAHRKGKKGRKFKSRKMCRRLIIRKCVS